MKKKSSNRELNLSWDECKEKIPSRIYMELSIRYPSLKDLRQFLLLEPFEFSQGKRELYEGLMMSQIEFQSQLNDLRFSQIVEPAFVDHSLSEYWDHLSEWTRRKVEQFYSKEMPVKEFLLIDPELYASEFGVGPISINRLKDDQRKLRLYLLPKQGKNYQTSIFDREQVSSVRKSKKPDKLASGELRKFHNQSISVLKGILPDRLLSKLLKVKLDTILKIVRADALSIENQKMLGKKHAKQLNLFQEHLNQNPRKIINSIANRVNEINDL